jgi:thiosulfate dehydrogenase
MTSWRVLLPALACFAAAACGGASSGAARPSGLHYALKGPLVPAQMTMMTAWDYPRNPLTDETLDDSAPSNEIKWGFRIFTNTPGEAPQLSPGKGSCNNCHLNAGQREGALPLVGVAEWFPQYSDRAGRLITLEDRIVDCFLREQNATERHAAPRGKRDVNGPDELPSPTTKEVVAVSAYLKWLSHGLDAGTRPWWYGQNVIAPEARIPVAHLEAAQGEAIFTARCVSCHGPDGQGVWVGDKKAGPLWGPGSWNDGADAARIYPLAGFIRYAMPYLEPGSLSDADAQQLAAFINSKPRPAFPHKAEDYPAVPLPAGSVYYPVR